jgi:hypothetical protein
MKHSFLVEVEVDESEHEALNAKRLRLSRQRRTIEDEITFLIHDSLQNKFTQFVSVTVATATPVEP